MDVSEIMVILIFAINMILLLLYIGYGIYRNGKENRQRQQELEVRRQRETERHRQLLEQYERQRQQQEVERQRRGEVIVSADVVINIELPPEEEARIKEIAAGCTECAVCLGDYDSDENGVVRCTLKPCGHRFHKACINRWFEEFNKDCIKPCPNCRALSSGDFSVSFHASS